MFQRAQIRSRSFSIRLRRGLQKARGLVQKGDMEGSARLCVQLIYRVLGKNLNEKGASESAEKLLARFPPSVRSQWGEAIRNHLRYFSHVAFSQERENVAKFEKGYPG